MAVRRRSDGKKATQKSQFDIQSRGSPSGHLVPLIGYRSAQRIGGMMMKRFLLTTFRCGVPFGLIMAIPLSFIAGWHLGILLGLVAGLLFGVSMAIFVGIQRQRFKTQRPDFSEERLLLEGPANHFLHGEGVGGWLYLTTRRLLFCSHAVNLQPHETDLPLTDIAEASPVLTAGFIPNGLLVRTVIGRNERFVVEQRKRWSMEIANARERNAKPEG
jgi:hypothetical protein